MGRQAGCLGCYLTDLTYLTYPTLPYPTDLPDARLGKPGRPFRPYRRVLFGATGRNLAAAPELSRWQEMPCCRSTLYGDSSALVAIMFPRLSIYETLTYLTNLFYLT